MEDTYLMYLRKSRADGEHETVEEVLSKHYKILQEYANVTYYKSESDTDCYANG